VGGSLGRTCSIPSGRTEDVVLLKHRFGAFVHTKRDQILRSNHIRTLVFAGVLTDVCVESTARAAIDLDYYVVVAGDCTATLSEERQRASLGIMANIIGVVVTADEVLEAWNASGRRAPA
jgi:ureidoacrylate peracid hydrolase